MSRHIDHVIGPRHDVEITVGITITRVTSFIIAGKGRQIFFDKCVIGAPDARQA